MLEAELLAKLRDGSLSPAAFNHTAHIRVARQLLLEQPSTAETAFCMLIQRYVQGLGAQDKFHHTLSVALLRLIATRLQPGQDWDTFQARNVDLFHAAQSLLAKHYSAEQLARGRCHWVAPDRLPLSKN